MNRFYITLLVFYVLYGYTDFCIQPNMEYPQWVRHHLCDVFAGPSCFAPHLITIIRIFSININQKLVPVVSLGGCIVIEILQGSRFDIIDVLCYIFGTILFFAVCNLLTN